MERCKDLIQLYCACLVILSFLSCRNNASSATAEGPDKGNDGMVSAMVIDHSELDGCTFILVLEDGTRLEPLELPEAFKRDSLKVMVKYSMIKRASICMVGKMVTVNEIKTCKEE